MPILLTSAELDRRIRKALEGSPMKIRTTHVYPPIPVREFDWCAVDDDTYDCDCDENGFFSTSPTGWGATEEEAIADLKSQMEDA